MNVCTYNVRCWCQNAEGCTNNHTDFPSCFRGGRDQPIGVVDAPVCPYCNGSGISSYTGHRTYCGGCSGSGIDGVQTKKITKGRLACPNIIFPAEAETYGDITRKPDALEKHAKEHDEMRKRGFDAQPRHHDKPKRPPLRWSY